MQVLVVRVNVKQQGFRFIFSGSFKVYINFGRWCVLDFYNFKFIFVIQQLYLGLYLIDLGSRGII